MKEWPDSSSEHTRDIKSLFDVSSESSDKDFPHSVYDTSLTFEKKHTFPGYKKEKTIDQFTSEESESFFRITAKPEIQFLTSQILGSAIHAAPIYINEQGEFFSKRVNFPENILEAAVDSFLLTVIANDWDHEIPYTEGSRSRNYENGSFFDFSHSKIALENIQRHEDDRTVVRNTQNRLKEIKQKLAAFCESRGLKVTQEEINNELKGVLTDKLNVLLQHVSSEKALTQMYEKIGYYTHYQHELLDPEELRTILVRKITIVLEQVQH